MKKKMALVFVLILLLISILPAGASAAPGDLTVSLPSFSVSLNGVRVENSYRQYPLLIYNDITYFPMTYYDCRFLGLETKWDISEGLTINKTGVTGAYRDYRGKSRNGNIYTASVPAFAVKVNGRNIDNIREEYPLLVFRDITYFPLTWKFCVEEFGWEYSFDPRNGLVIQSANQKLEKATLPEYKEGDVIVADQHFYYGGSDGGIYQAPVNNPQDAKKIYQLPLWSYGDSYVPYRLSKKDGETWLTYHQGGAIMGSDHYIKLKPDGSYEEVEAGYLTFRTFGDITIKVDQGVPPGRNNLMLKYEGQEYERVGDPNYLYGWDYELRGTSAGGSPSKDLHLEGDFIYVLAVNKEKDIDASRVYRVNINTGETSRVSDLRVKSFKMDGNNIYFASNGKLYCVPVNGGNEIQLETTGPVSDAFNLQVLDGHVYYVNSLNNELYRTGTDTSLNPGARVTALKVEEGYLIATFAEDNHNSYRLIIFDKSGDAVFKTADVASIAGISIENGRLFYVESTSKHIYSADLPR